MNFKSGDLLGAVYFDRLPHSVLVCSGREHAGEQTMDVNWTQFYEQGYYHESGSGPWEGTFTIGQLNGTAEVWVADGMRLVDYEGKPVEDPSAWGWTVLDAEKRGARTWDEFEEKYGLVWGDGRWCNVCAGWTPDDEQCQHVGWHDYWGDYCGAGAVDTAYDWQAHREDLETYFRENPDSIAKVLAALQARDHSAVQAAVNAMDEVAEGRWDEDDAAQTVYYWLWSLADGKAKEAIGRTVGWLEGVQRE